MKDIGNEEAAMDALHESQTMKDKPKTQEWDSPAAQEFQRRFPDTWESFSTQQKLHVVYCMNGWACSAQQSHKDAKEVNHIKNRGEVINLLIEYTNFLLGSQYVDTDVYGEEPTAIDLFMAIWDDDNPASTSLPDEGEDIKRGFTNPVEGFRMDFFPTPTSQKGVGTLLVHPDDYESIKATMETELNKKR